VSPEVKDHTASFAVALWARGLPLETIIKLLSDTPTAPAERTQLRHMAAIKGGMAPLSAEKGAGRPAALTDESWAVVFGWVLRQQKSVDLETVQRWIKANLGHWLSPVICSDNPTSWSSRLSSWVPWSDFPHFIRRSCVGPV
jgi:hypothetical protein